MVLTDWFLRRGQDVRPLLFDRRHAPWAGVVAMAVGMAVSIALFSNQTDYVAPLPKHHPALGDLTFEVGFVVSALVYAALHTLERRRSGSPAAA